MKLSKAISFLRQVVPHRNKGSIRMWIPETERLKMSAAEVKEGRVICVNILTIFPFIYT